MRTEKPHLKLALKIKALVGAGRFERPTPCAQGRFQRTGKIAHFQRLLFQAEAANLWNPVEPFGLEAVGSYIFIYRDVLTDAPGLVSPRMTRQVCW